MISNVADDFLADEGGKLVGDCGRLDGEDILRGEDTFRMVEGLSRRRSILIIVDWGVGEGDRMSEDDCISVSLSSWECEISRPCIISVGGSSGNGAVSDSFLFFSV